MEQEKVEITAQEMREFMEYKRLQEEKARVEADKEAYKTLVDTTIGEVFPLLQEVSGRMAEIKREVYDKFDAAIGLKQEIYQVREGQRSNSFMSADGQRRIILGHHQTDDYDDTVNAGIAKVQEVIASFAQDPQSKLLVDAILRLLSRDQKGTLKASRVVQLKKIALECQNQELIAGVEIIERAYRPAISKLYIRAEYKDKLGKWQSVPLGMTEV